MTYSSIFINQSLGKCKRTSNLSLTMFVGTYHTIKTFPTANIKKLHIFTLCPKGPKGDNCMDGGNIVLHIWVKVVPHVDKNFGSCKGSHKLSVDIFMAPRTLLGAQKSSK